MPVATATALLIASAVTALSATGAAVEGNQERQHAKGAAEAQQTAMDAQLADAKKKDEANNAARSSQGSATQAAALAALRASMTASSGFGGSIMTSGTGTTPVTTTGKTLLGA